jgi:hypothetical protein
MTQYWVAIHHPDDYGGALEDEAMGRDRSNRSMARPARFAQPISLNEGPACQSFVI